MRLLKDWITGDFNIYVHRGDGSLKYEEHHHNLVVNDSRLFLGDLLRGDPNSSALVTMAVGTGTSDPELTDTALQTEIFRKALPTADINTALAANVLDTSGGNTVLTLRQILKPFIANDGISTADQTSASPGAALVPPVTIREFGLFGDISTMTDPTTQQTNLTEDSGTIGNGTYGIQYTYANTGGETLPTTSKNYTVVSGPNSSIEISVPQRPDNSTKIKVYVDGVFEVESTSSDSPALISITSLGGSVAPPTVNTTAPPGLINTGRLFNRAKIGSGSGVTLDNQDSIIIESVLTIG